MNRISILSLVFVACTLIFGCNKDKVNSELGIKDNQTSVGFGKAGGLQSINVECLTTWTASVPDAASSWLSCSPLSSEGNDKVSIGVMPYNGGTAPRTGVVNIQAQDGTVIPVNVTQFHADPSVGTIPKVPTGGGNAQVTVTSPATWSVVTSSLPDWISTQNQTQTGITLAVKANTGFPRNANITFALNEFPNITFSAKVEQDADALLLSAGDDLAAILQDPGNSGKIIVLPGGSVWEVNATLLMSCKALMTDPAATQKATLKMTGNAKLFRFPDNVDVDGYRFENLKLVGGTYFIQNSNVDPNVEKIIRVDAITFENCEISNFIYGFISFSRGAASPADPRTDKSIGTVTLNNCIMKDMSNNKDGGPTFACNNDAGSGGIDNMVITRSTFQNLGHNFINALFHGNKNSVKTIRIELCTFYDFLKDPQGPNGVTNADRYFIDGNNNTELKITLKNTIFGYTPVQSSLRSHHRLLAANREADYLTLEGNYRTSDQYSSVANNYNLFDYNLGGTGMARLNAANPDFGRDITSDILWTNPANGNFSFKWVDFPGWNKAGDPRWWK